jgi:hypothetical protein
VHFFIIPPLSFCAENNPDQTYATVKNWQADHQASVVEIEGIYANHYISILIELGYNLSYIAPKVLEARVFIEKKTCKVMVGPTVYRNQEEND